MSGFTVEDRKILTGMATDVALAAQQAETNRKDIHDLFSKTNKLENEQVEFKTAQKMCPARKAKGSASLAVKVALAGVCVTGLIGIASIIIAIFS